ncbi:cellulose biosynthesis cyclic di-GMP-binding regulatory protein BcsB [Halothiobacillus sp.]|uniref:cellulose biosynthesis cyclic di-GMP-binding regulatory protein BcsB n=1 Tax=Halothiobacillus sp. TaxID=1891311 RepID=UPI00261C7D09|nr:cellulose biosynthesis cyclic di-GMP-binding regulatory protein BcsB [Halothiobacillus sp.]
MFHYLNEFNTYLSRLVLSFCLLMPLIALAGTQPMPLADVSGEQITLAHLLGTETPLTLIGEDAQTSFTLPIAQLVRVLSINLTLALVPSAGLNNDSWLMVRINGLTVGQINLVTARLQGNAISLAIPVAVLKPGYNKVQLFAAQHSPTVCAPALSPELFTQVNTENSFFTLSTTPINPDLTLAQLGELFDPSSEATQAEVPVFVSNPNGALQATTLAYAAQGVARRFNYLPVNFSVLPLAKAAQPAVTQAKLRPTAALLIGNYTELTPYLAGLNLSDTQTPRLIVRRFDAAPARYLVILVANTIADQQQLALRFALTELPLPAVHSLNLDSLAVYGLPIPTPQRQNNEFQFRDLGIKSATLSGVDAPALDFQVWNAGWKQKAQVRLHLAYAAGMSKQSALNVWINDVQQGSIPLNLPQGGEYADFAVTLPTTLLTAGWNKIRLQPVLIPISNGGECKHFFPGNLSVSVFDDSKFIWMGNGSEEYTRDLVIFSGFNSMKWVSDWLEGLNIHLSGNNADLLSAAMTLTGKLSQVAHSPLIQLNVGTTLPKNDWPTILISTLDALNTENKQRFGLSPGQVLSRLQNNTPGDIAPLSWDAKPKLTTWVESNSAFDLTHTTLAAVAEDTMQPAYLFAASTPATLQTGMARAVGFGVWSQLTGTLAYWPYDGKPVVSIGRTQEPFRNYGLQRGLSIWVTQNPWYGLLIVLMAGTLTALVMRWGLTIYRRRRHEKNET